MDTGITVAVLIAMIALGAFVIHRLNAQHAERIALHHYSRRLPARDGAPGSTRPQPGGTAPPAAPGVRVRRDHRDGGRGRFRPRRRTNRAAKDRTT
ncbi:hypothetical protein ABT390_13165 [Streptomyces aurantiacus]|uniref:Uncharacterized protein n=1 Tax=Streptomyces aurantiacus JA 4570 TaxID=1286094 RepID=S3ZI05_9ACTN|nr:hypothetical protein [Streptomyces aurantiacus]EPH42319.1 hypothetical protein STRAU_4648 [Streptomyces aurantiacus JA 4570]